LYDWLLFLHLLTAFTFAAAVVIQTAIVLGAPTGERVFSVSSLLWDIGGIGVLVFGVWLTLDVDGYELWDGWIIAALVLWAIATELGRKIREELSPASTGAGMAERSAVIRHWLRVAVVIAFVIVMVYKPGA
jgi:drug/metabolite transporter (DMT)-like permease